MDQLAGDLLNDSDSDDQDYVPSEGEPDDVNEDDDIDKEGNASEDDEAQKHKTESLWADFLSDVDPPPPAAKKPKIEQPSPTAQQQLKTGQPEKQQQPTTSQSSESAGIKSTESGSSSQATNHPSTSASEKIKITQVFDFAGEKIEVEKEVDKDSKEAKKLLAEQKKLTETPQQQKVLLRPKVGGGLSTIVGSVINKKNKMSILEKSKLDWTGFKKEEGIEEDLANHNKGKDGYLEKVAFFERADMRQFELEKQMREKLRRGR